MGCIRDSVIGSPKNQLCSPSLTHLFRLTDKIQNFSSTHESVIDDSSLENSDHNFTLGDGRHESTVYLDNVPSTTDSPYPLLFGDFSHESSPLETKLNVSMYQTTVDRSNNSGNPFVGAEIVIHHPILAIILGLMCITVIFGNVLVMVAIKRERYLKTVTNYFVASLAAADCLVGLIVMPFSVVHEVMNKWWVFGQDWCDLWHSFDVLASTASILNLCVISLDR